MPAPHFPIPRRPVDRPASAKAQAAQAAPTARAPRPSRRLLPPAAGPKMRVLSVLSSSNQMYSGSAAPSSS